MTQGVERARLDQRLDRTFVEHPRGDPAAKIIKVSERTAGLPLTYDPLYQPLSHVADGGEPERDQAPGLGVPSITGGDHGGRADATWSTVTCPTVTWPTVTWPLVTWPPAA